jgi:hypothetical protein
VRLRSAADLRRTVATSMADRHRAVLNHLSGSKSGVAGVCNRALYQGEKLRLTRWDAHLMAAIEGRDLLLHEQRAMPGGGFRSWLPLLRKPKLSAVTPDQRRGGERSPSPGWRAIRPSRRTRPAGSRASIPGGSSKTICLDRRTQPRRPP